MFGLAGKLFKKTTANTAHWAGSHVLSSAGCYISDLATAIFKNKRTYEQITYEQAVVEYELDADKLADKKTSLKLQCCVYLILALLVFVYACYCLACSKIYMFVAVALMCVLLFAFAFRASFWLYQLNQCKLGLNFSGWLKYILAEDS